MKHNCYHIGRHKGKARHYLTEEEVRHKEEQEKREAEWRVRMMQLVEWSF